jgi:hypothetical protein
MFAWLALALAASAVPVYALKAVATIRQDRAALCGRNTLPQQCDANVEAVARPAFAQQVAGMFAPPTDGSSPDLTLDFVVDRARLQPLSGFPEAEVDVRATVRDGQGQVIAMLSCHGGQQVFQLEPDAVAVGFEKALAVAADDFRDRFANSEAVVSWMRGRGVVPAGSRILGPARGDLVLFADGSAGPSLGTEIGTAFYANLGVSGRWFLLRGIAGTLGVKSPGGSDISTQLLGIEAGPALRLGRNWEIHGGIGLNFASGTLTPNGPPAAAGFSGDFSRKLPSAFLGAMYVFPEGSLAPLRLRVSLDARTYFDHDVTFLLVREVAAVADAAVVASIGIEFPLIKSSLPSL